MQSNERPGDSAPSPRRWKAKSSTTERENPLRNTMISAEGFVMFVFRECASKGCIFRDVDKMLHLSVTVARCEQNAGCDVNRMLELLWLYCQNCFGSVAWQLSQCTKKAGLRPAKNPRSGWLLTEELFQKNLELDLHLVSGADIYPLDQPGNDQEITLLFRLFHQSSV